MVHIKQSYPVSCGAATFAMLVNCPEWLAIKECKTKETGTCTNNVIKAFEDRQISIFSIRCYDDFSYLKPFLKLLSNQYKMYVSGEFRNKTRGRDSIRHHAFAIWKEKVYDPGENCALEINAVNHLFSKSLLIKEVILIGF